MRRNRDDEDSKDEKILILVVLCQIICCVDFSESITPSRVSELLDGAFFYVIFKRGHERAERSLRLESGEEAAIVHITSTLYA